MINDFAESRIYGGNTSQLPGEFLKIREDSPDPCRYVRNDLKFGCDAQNVILGSQFLNRSQSLNYLMNKTRTPRL